MSDIMYEGRIKTISFSQGWMYTYTYAQSNNLVITVSI